MKLADFPQIHGLPVSAKLEIVGELWDEIARDPGALPIPEWHIAELEQSRSEYEVAPREGATWEEVKARIMRRQ